MEFTATFLVKPYFIFLTFSLRKTNEGTFYINSIYDIIAMRLPKSSQYSNEEGAWELEKATDGTSHNVGAPLRAVLTAKAVPGGARSRLRGKSRHTASD